MFKELSKEKKRQFIEGLLIASSTALVYFGIGYMLGSKYTKAAFSAGLDKCFRVEPGLREHMVEALNKVSLEK